ncbi:MAG: hypothetical protein AB8H79_22645 [Myxococcota bacterium]
MPLPDDFAQECLYSPEAWFVHDLIEVDVEASAVVGRVDTTKLGPLVDAQREWAGHPKHFPGAIALQITGTLGQLHAVYVMGLRPTDGWAGFGTHILEARFRHLGVIGPEVLARCEATRIRKVRGTVFTDYTFTYTQEGKPIYESRQRAAWFNSGA